ncbi:MAG: GAF domain-containing protein [Caldilineales bacterium]|nr:GAF domain-containing protein [Caldilineales bacterium]
MSETAAGLHPLAGQALVDLQVASQALARAQIDEESVLTFLRQQVQHLLPPVRVHILLFFAENSQLFAWNRRGEALPPSYFETAAAQGIIGWLRETKEALLVGDFHRDWEALPARPSYDNPDPPRAAIFVPLVVADEALGALSAQSEEPDVFTPDHLWQLRILANQAAAALRAGRLLRSERWRANELQTLAQITRSVVSILDLDALLSHIVEVIEQNFGFYHVQIFVVEKGSDRALFRASSGDQTHDLWRQMGRSVQLHEKGIIPWVLSHGETLVAPDVSIDPLYVPDDPHLLPNTRSEIAIPLRLEEEVLGVLDVQSAKTNAFGPEDLFILNALADTVALAVTNAQLYARVQEDAWITVALLEVAEATNHLTELQEVSDTIVRITPMLTGVTLCALWLRSAAGPIYQIASEWGVPEELKSLLRKQELSEEAVARLGLAAGETQPRLLRSQELDEQLPPILAQALSADVVAFMPLLAKSECIGLLAVSLTEPEAHISQTRLPLLKGIADQAASALENAQLIAAQRQEAWINTALLQVAEAMGRARDLPETLDIVARLTAALSGLDRCTIFLRHGDGFQAAISHALARDLPPIPPTQRLHPDHTPLLEHLLAQRAPIVVNDLQNSGFFSPAWLQAMRVNALTALPLIAGDEVVGVMVVDEVTPQRIHTPRLLDILGGIANQASVAIERARLHRAEFEQQRIATELNLAHNIQRGFLPESLPALPGYEIAALWEPARQIGGDFYDFFPLPDGRLGIVVADVADKGIPAALYMALCRTVMRLVVYSDPAPAAALQRVNTAILDTTYSDMFVALYYAVLDSTQHSLCYASGGHGLALAAGAAGARFLRGRGMVLGVLADAQAEEHSAQLAADEYLIIYTDGVTDAVNEALETYDEERLLAAIQQHAGCTATEMLQAIHADVRAWQGAAPPFDDFTLVIVRRLPPPAPAA